MSQRQITDRYAKALFDLAEEENSLYPVYVSLQEITTILKEKKDLYVFIHNPLLSLEERASILTKVFENKIPGLLLKFLLFMNVKNRLNTLADVFDSLDVLFLEKNNQIRADLQTPYAISDDQKENIQRKLNKKYHKEITLDSHVNPDLLGGFRLLAEGTLYDGTIKTQLEQFRQKVLA
jgi:F-type H+-transporting ATPase subunit delta